MPVDVIDYTYLQKRGLLKKSVEQKSVASAISKDGFIDLGAFDTNSSGNVSEQASEPNNLSVQPSNEGGMFGFMDNPSTNNGGSFFDSPTETSKPADGSEVNALKLKIDDLEFKLSNLMDKFSQVESKLLDFERKVTR